MIAPGQVTSRMQTQRKKNNNKNNKNFELRPKKPQIGVFNKTTFPHAAV